MLSPGSCLGSVNFSHTSLSAVCTQSLSYGDVFPTKLFSIAAGPCRSAGQLLLETGVFLSHSLLICSFFQLFIPCTVDSLTYSARCMHIRDPESWICSGTILPLTASMHPVPDSGALARHWEQGSTTPQCLLHLTGAIGHLRLLSRARWELWEILNPQASCGFPWGFILSFPCGSDGKESAGNVGGDLGSIPGPGRSPGEGNGNPLQYSCLENPMDGGSWQSTVHGVTESLTWLSDFTFTFKYLSALESQVLAEASGHVESYSALSLPNGVLWASLVAQRSTCQCRRHGFDPWVGKIPWRRK